MNLLKRFLGNGDKPARKPTEHSPNFVPLWQRLPDSIAQEYETSTMLEIANRYQVSQVVVSQKLKKLGVMSRRPSVSPDGVSRGLIRLTKEQIEWALDQDLKGASHADTGNALGVTNERIRQLCMQAGHSARRSRMTKTEEIKEASRARVIEREKRVKEISDSWNAGATLKELNDTFFHYTHHYSVSNRISAYRNLYPDLFPRRMKSHQPGKFQPIEEINKISELWRSGRHVAEIAKECGYKSKESLYQRLQNLRIKYPDKFPVRKRFREPGHVEELSSLWLEGKSITEIARKMGYTCAKSVYRAVRNYKKQFPDLFPSRK